MDKVKQCSNNNNNRPKQSTDLMMMIILISQVNPIQYLLLIVYKLLH
jgi:hypothetical protein